MRLLTCDNPILQRGSAALLKRKTPIPPPATYQIPTGMPYPRCAVCNRDVRRMDHWQDPNTNELVFRVKCHGAVDIIRMPAIPPAPGTHLTIGEAFQKKLASPNAQIGEHHGKRSNG